MSKLKDLILFNVWAKLEDEVVHHYIGYLWWILEPAMLVTIYYLVFKLILNRGEDDYIYFLFIGIVTWKWFGSSVSAGANSLYAAKSLYKKINLPKIIFPWIECVFYTVKFLIILSLIIIVYALSNYPVFKNIIYLPILIFCQFVFTLGLSTLLSSILPYFVDLKIIVALFIRLGFYPSGVIFDLSRVPEKYDFIVNLNPLALSIQAFRDLIMRGTPPPLYTIVFLLSSGFILYILGYTIIQKLDKKYAKIAL
ncbi:MAG TPA: ABC transporter permease [Oligoflexia bacterium]|nr:ABC transporter permease [Oligoflexia bacterium]HMR23806.1 ABC transporter permease [Oligoflexia bacterium]